MNKELGKLSIYQIYIKSFYDSDRDGMGDLRGICQKLPYIKNLGAKYIWITPFLQSPQEDNGYDIQNYKAIDPCFGTMHDFEELVEAAGKYGIGIMMDMVLNHTSDQHMWFQKALAGDPAYQDFYIFREGRGEKPPTNWESKFGGSAWEYLPGMGKYYLHLFSVHQPDLNWDNPRVREKLYEIVNFWLKKGVKGLRFDVINLVSKPERFEDDPNGDGRRYYTDGPNIHRYLHELNRNTFGSYPDVLTAGELSSTDIKNCVLYTNPENQELDTAFQFYHLRVDYQDGRKWTLCPPDFAKLKQVLNRWQTGIGAGGGNISLFWSNHDQPRILSRFGDCERYPCESAKALATLLYFMGGIPCIYQGEELGMRNAGFDCIEKYRDVESINYYHILRQNGYGESNVLKILGQKSRDNARTPMCWDDTANNGFTQGIPWINLGISGGGNAALEIKDPDSVFFYYKRILQIRDSLKVAQEGRFEMLDTKLDALFSYVRRLGTQTLLVISSLSEKMLDMAEAALNEAGRYSSLERLLGNYAVKTAYASSLPPTLQPYESIVYLCEK